MKIKRVFPVIKAKRAIVFGLLIASMNIAVVAQQNGKREDGASATASASSLPSSRTEEPVSPNEPLTFKERFTDYRQSTFYPTALIFPALTAGFSQLRDYPTEWRQGGQGYGKRLLSSYGNLVVGNTISFSVAALDREDLRYVRSTYPKKAILRRAGYAIGHTFVSPLEGSGRTFAWSRLAGAYGAGFVSNTWYPAGHSTVHNAVYLGSFNLATDVGFNLLREFIRPQFIFGPDKKKP